MPGPATASQNISRFDPRSIANCVQWLDASDRNTLFTDVGGTIPVTTNGNTVNFWKDKSIYGNNVITNTVAPSYITTLSGISAAVNFAGGGGLKNTTGYALASNASLFVVCAPNGWGQWGTLWGHFRSGNHDNDIQLRQAPVTNGFVNWHTNNDNVNYLALPASNTRVIYSCTMSNGVNMFMQNFYTGNNNALSFTEGTLTIASGTVAPLWIGRSDTNELYNGYISEIIYYQTVLTLSQRKTIEGYLAWKWGLQTDTTRNLIVSHPFYRTQPFSRNLNVLDIGIPEYWFDAADTATITRSGNFLTTWSNKGSFVGSNVTPTVANTATSGTTSFNGYNLINIPITQRIQFTGSFPTFSRARFIVTRQTSAGDVTYMFQGGTSASGNDYLGISTNGLIEVAQGVANRMLSPAIAAQTNLMALLTFFNSSLSTGNNRVSLNGSNITLTTSVVASSYNTGSITTFLGHTSGSGQDIGEFISFNSELSLSQVFMVEAYLARKWKLTLATTHPFYSVSSSTALPFLPTNLKDCILWLDGADPAGTGILPAAGVQSSWTDKSANVWTATQATVGRQPSLVLNSLNGLPGFIFTNASNQSFITAAQTSLNTITGLSIFAVLLPTWTSGAAVGNPAFFGLRISNAGVSKINYYVHNNYTQTNVFNGATTVFHTSAATTAAIGVNRVFIYSGTNNNVTDSTYLNGSLTADSVAITFGTGTSLPINIGGDNTDGQRWQGYIYEVILYKSVLTMAQRQKVEGYLAQKWNLNLLPLTHPYKLFAPSPGATPFEPTSVTMSAVTASGATVTWSGGSDATSYTCQIYSSTVAAMTSPIIVSQTPLSTASVTSPQAFTFTPTSTLYYGAIVSAVTEDISVASLMSTGVLYTAAAAFVPTSIATLFIWVDATDPAGNGTTPATGSLLATWVDKSGGARNIVQTTSLVAPTFNTNQQNAKPGVLFNSKSMNIPTLNLSPISIFCVLRAVVLSGNIFVSLTGGTGIYLRASTGTAVPTYNSWGIDYGAAAYRYTSATANTDLNAHVWSFTLPSGGVTGRFTFDGTVGLGNGFTSAQIAASSSTASLGCYSRNNTNAPINGYIYELLIFSSAISLVNQTKMEGYLAWKWGLQGNLPAAHTFKNAAPTA